MFVDVADQAGVDGVVPVLEEDYADCFRLEYVYFEISQQILDDLLALLVEEVWAKFEHEPDQLFRELPVLLLAQHVAVDVLHLRTYELISFFGEVSLLLDQLAV